VAATAAVQMVGCGEGGRRTRSDPSLQLQLLYYTTTAVAAKKPHRIGVGVAAERSSGRVSARALARQNRVGGPSCCTPAGTIFESRGPLQGHR